MEQLSMLEPEIKGGAKFSDCGKYRYSLTREWDPEGKRLCLIMLNPSTANATEDDATTRRCLAFARRWGFGKYIAVNLFAFRTTNPAELKKADDPIGPGNIYAILGAAVFSDMVVAAWGVHGELLGRDEEIKMALAMSFKPIYCFGKTKDGHPKHPLYLASDADQEIFLKGIG